MRKSQILRAHGNMSALNFVFLSCVLVGTKLIKFEWTQNCWDFSEHAKMEADRPGLMRERIKTEI